MDYQLINNVVNELKESLAGAKIGKIHQPDADTIVIRYWDGRTNRRLLVSVAAKRSRIHLTEQEFLNPSMPPRFCQLLRARASRIEGIELHPSDRIVFLSLVGKSGDCKLVVELTGVKTNMFLLDERGGVIDSLRREDKDHGSSRLTGQVWSEPHLNNAALDLSQNQAVEKNDSLTWSQFVENSYSADAVEGGSSASLADKVRTILKRYRKKLNKRLSSIERELEKQEGSERFQQYGDLLLANLHKVKRGMESITVDDYYSQSPGPIDISLLPELLPQENAARYFKRYKKMQRGIDHSLRRIEETEEELKWLEQLDYQLDDDDDIAEIEEIAQELRRAGLLKDTQQLHKRRTRKQTQLQESVSPSGIKVLWGRNNRQNDEISTRQLKVGDLWFHAHGAPGAHVVLKGSQSAIAVTDRDRLYAASIAAGYSKKRNDSKVEVIVAETGAVKKPKGAKPGLVVVNTFKTVMVEPLRVESSPL